MKLKPHQQKTDPDYPPVSGLTMDRRGFLRLISAAGLAAAALPALASDPEAGKKAETKTLEQTVKKLAVQLGHDDFRKRRSATKGLILIGKGIGIDKTRNEKIKAMVLAAMKPLLKHKDPEVSQRAKQICLALDPPQKPKLPPNNLPRIAGW